MSPTTRSARVGAGARAPVSSGTPMEVSVAPLPDGSWVVKPRAGTVPPRRTRPRKDYSGLFTPLADALEHGPGNSCISHDPGFAALRDNLRVRHRAVYRGAVATASAAVDDEETLAPHHEPSAQPAEETPHVHSIPAHSCDDRDENSDPALLLGTTNATDADTDAHCDAAGVHQDTEKTTGRVTVQTEFPDLYALPEDTQEDPRLAPAEVVGTGATAVYPSAGIRGSPVENPGAPASPRLARHPTEHRPRRRGRLRVRHVPQDAPRHRAAVAQRRSTVLAARVRARDVRRGNFGVHSCAAGCRRGCRGTSRKHRGRRANRGAAEGLCARRARGGFAEGRGGGELFSKLGPADPRWTTRAVARYVRTGRRASARRRGQELHVPEPRDVQQDAGAARGG